VIFELQYPIHAQYSRNIRVEKNTRSVHNMSTHEIAEQREADLSFTDLPPFPEDVSTAPLLRISLSKLTQGDSDEIDRLWKACRELGFFYLDLRGVLTERGFDETGRADSATGDDDRDAQTKAENAEEFEVDIDGERLLQNAEALFKVGKSLFDLPVEEKVKYDLKDQGSYFGYKGYGQGVIDAEGTKDRNEFYNVRKISRCSE
jgi:hypothetical protein